MASVKFGKRSFNQPAPRWFRKTKKIISLLTNVVLAILAIRGYADNSPLLLEIKIVQSFVLDTLDTIMSNGEVYSIVEDTDEPKKV